MRTIRIKTNFSAQPVSVTTGAHTFIELKNDPAVKAIGIDWSSNKLISKDSKVSIELDETILPQDVFFFVHPTKTKSGADYTSYSFSELRKACAVNLPKGTISANPTKQEMIDALNHLDRTSISSSTANVAQKVVTATTSTKVAATEFPTEPVTKAPAVKESYYEKITDDTLKADYNKQSNELLSKGLDVRGN